MTVLEQGEDRRRLVLVTGPSGAGRATAIHALEDLGYEAIDNIPLSLVARLLDTATATRPIALGIDARTRDFAPAALGDTMAWLARRSDVSAELLFLECRPEVLMRRFSETRRRHPLAGSAGTEQAIAEELRLLAPVRALADHVLDTSELTPHDLGREIARRFGPPSGKELAVTIQSFSYRRGLPPAADIVFDCRFLDNPHWVEELRPLTGRDAAVSRHVLADPRYEDYASRVMDLLSFQIPACQNEGKAHLTVAMGCTGGRHRSVAVAEDIARRLRELGWRVSVHHKELERQPAADGGATGEAP